MGLYKLTKKEDKQSDKALSCLFQTKLFGGFEPTEEEKAEAREVLSQFSEVVKKRRYPMYGVEVGDAVICNVSLFGERYKKVLVRVDEIDKGRLTFNGTIMEGVKINGCKCSVPFADVISNPSAKGGI